MSDQLDQEYRHFLAELIAVLDDEELIRLSYRLRKAGKSAAAGLLQRELAMREDRHAQTRARTHL